MVIVYMYITLFTNIEMLNWKDGDSTWSKLDGCIDTRVLSCSVLLL